MSLLFEEHDGVDFATGVQGALQPMGMLRDVQWAVPLVVLSSVNVTVILCYEIALIVKKVCAETCSRRRVFLGQMLLVGLLLSSLGGLAFAIVPSMVACGIVKLMGIAHTVVISSLLVEFIFLKSLSQGIFLPGEYLVIVATFAMAVQVGISTAWVTLRTTEISATSCGEPLTSHLVALLYPALLLVAMVIISVRLRVRQARLVGMAVACEVLAAITTVSLGLILGPEAEEACVAFGLVASASAVFVVTFLLRGQVDADLEMAVGTPSPSLCNCKLPGQRQFESPWDLPLPPTTPFKPILTVSDMAYHSHPALTPGQSAFCHHQATRQYGYGPPPPGALYYCVGKQLTPPARTRYCRSSVMMY